MLNGMVSQGSVERWSGAGMVPTVPFSLFPLRRTDLFCKMNLALSAKHNTPNNIMKTAIKNYRTTFAPGSLFSHANTWPRHWKRTTYKVSADGQNALPLVREHFWGSVAGEVEDVSGESPIPLSQFLELSPSPRNEVRACRSVPEVTQAA